MNSKYRGLSHEIVSPLLLFATSESVYYSMSYLHFKFLPKGVRKLYKINTKNTAIMSCNIYYTKIAIFRSKWAGFGFDPFF